MTDAKQTVQQLNTLLDRILQAKNNPQQVEQAVNEAKALTQQIQQGQQQGQAAR